MAGRYCPRGFHGSGHHQCREVVPLMETIKCGKCKKVSVLPSSVSWSMCACGQVIKDTVTPSQQRQG